MPVHLQGTSSPVHMQVCFVIQELDLVLQSSKRTLPDFFKDLAVALVLGKALPILVAAVIEARSRSEFLRARCAIHLQFRILLIVAFKN